MRINPLTKLLLLSTLSISTLVFANDGKQNLISFEVTSHANVENDEISATMSKSLTAKNAKELANKMNPIINQALAIAKKYPSVQVATGSQHAYPEYSKGKIIGVSGLASINLKSQNSEDLSSLMAELQNILLLEQLNFDASSTLLENTQAQLRDETTQKFQKEAQSMVKAWGAKNYRLINAQMNGGGTSYYRKTLSPMMAIAEQAADASAPRQHLETGNSEIRYTINGTIELIF